MRERKKQTTILLGVALAAAGSAIFDMSYWVIWLSARGRNLSAAICGDPATAAANCMDDVLTGKIVFSFLLPFFLFIPVGYFLNMMGPRKCEWVCRRKWMISTISLAALVILAFLTTSDALSYVGKFIVGLFSSAAVAVLISTAWIVFFHHRSHLFKRY